VITGTAHGPVGDRDDNQNGYHHESRELRHLPIRKVLASWWR
jgi:hypothetical protein